MRIWTLWARSSRNGVVAPIEIASEAALSVEGADPAVTWVTVASEAKQNWPEVTDWFTRVIDVADASIINDTDATVVGAVVPPVVNHSTPVREVPVPTAELEESQLATDAVYGPLRG